MVDNKKGCIICTNSFVALATQIAGVMLTVVGEEFVKSHSSQKYFVLLLVFFLIGNITIVI